MQGVRRTQAPALGGAMKGEERKKEKGKRSRKVKRVEKIKRRSSKSKKEGAKWKKK